MIPFYSTMLLTLMHGILKPSLRPRKAFSPFQPFPALPCVYLSSRTIDPRGSPNISFHPLCKIYSESLETRRTRARPRTLSSKSHSSQNTGASFYSESTRGCLNYVQLANFLLFYDIRDRLTPFQRKPVLSLQFFVLFANYSGAEIPSVLSKRRGSGDLRRPKSPHELLIIRTPCRRRATNAPSSLVFVRNRGRVLVQRV